MLTTTTPTTVAATTHVLPPSTDEPPRILLNRWRHVRSLADAFWKRFTKEYVSSLQQRRKWPATRRNLAVGDVVLIAESTPRDEWNIAQVIETFPDRGGLVRRVRLKTSKKKELERHVNSLVLLEATDKNLLPGGTDPPTSASASVQCVSAKEPFYNSVNYLFEEFARRYTHLRDEKIDVVWFCSFFGLLTQGGV